MKRLLLTSSFVLAALALSVSNVAASGAYRVSYHSSQQLLIARDRAHAARKAPLYWNSCLARYANQQAQAMASRHALFHSNVRRLFGCRTGAGQAGENVGAIYTGGVSMTHNFLDTTINGAFMASPHHRANILGPYHYVGTAWARSQNGDWFIAVEFA